MEGFKTEIPRTERDGTVRFKFDVAPRMIVKPVDLFRQMGRQIGKWRACKRSFARRTTSSNPNKGAGVTEGAPSPKARAAKEGCALSNAAAPIIRLRVMAAIITSLVDAASCHDVHHWPCIPVFPALLLRSDRFADVKRR